MDERIIGVGDVELSVAESGAGQRPLLLLHGFTGAKEDFTEWLDGLADAGWHAVAPDHRGHGASSKPTSEEAYSFDILADDVQRLTERLDWPRFALLGHSMGGMVAQLVASREPERLDALVLMDTGHGPVEGLDPELVDAAVEIVRTRGVGALAELLEEVGSPLDSPPHQRLLDRRPGYAQFEERKFRATSPALYAALAPEFIATADRLARLGELPSSLPTLVMVGDQDIPFLGASERMAAAIPGASLAVIPDAGHTPQFESPEAWWDALSAFLSRVSSTGDRCRSPMAG